MSTRLAQTKFPKHRAGRPHSILPEGTTNLTQRKLDRAEFNRTFDELIVHGKFNEVPEYYPRFKSRYWALLEVYADSVRPSPVDLLDIGGGQFATMAAALWGDRATVADVGGKNYDYLREHHVEPVEWNLVSDAQPFSEQFDAIIFSEVIEHLPIPGHIILERLKRALRPGGVLICSTPNLFRLRNVAYLTLGKQIFDNFQMPVDRGLGHVLEYSHDHLEWQFRKAGFRDVDVQIRHFHHNPKSIPFRVLSWLGSPLFLIPRFRNYLVAVARAPVTSVAEPQIS
jgi:2-polyprenyl-3-methyl-5-hydroxy-6-metoxy-1,4-benzoquinol methylase